MLETNCELESLTDTPRGFSGYDDSIGPLNPTEQEWYEWQQKQFAEEQLACGDRVVPNCPACKHYRDPRQALVDLVREVSGGNVVKDAKLWDLMFYAEMWGDAAQLNGTLSELGDKCEAFWKQHYWKMLGFHAQKEQYSRATQLFRDVAFYAAGTRRDAMKFGLKDHKDFAIVHNRRIFSAVRARCVREGRYYDTCRDFNRVVLGAEKAKRVEPVSGANKLEREAA